MEKITIVSGLPRSGTSLMMSILKNGGMSILEDQQRRPDEDNPRGYYEYEKVKDLAKNNSWVCDHGGKVIKVISFLLKNLPDNMNYDVIFMNRNIKEVLKSQSKMLERSGVNLGSVSDDVMEKKFLDHLEKTNNWFSLQKNMKVYYVDYSKLVKDTNNVIHDLCLFLGRDLNKNNMLSAVDKNLYRQKS